MKNLIPPVIDDINPIYIAYALGYADARRSLPDFTHTIDESLRLDYAEGYREGVRENFADDIAELKAKQAAT